MLKKVLKSIIACSLAVGLLIGSGNEVVQAKVKGYCVHNCIEDDIIYRCNHHVKVFFEGQESYLLFYREEYVDKESPDSDWGYASVLIVSTINERDYTNYILYSGPSIIVGLDGNRILDGAVVYKTEREDVDNAYYCNPEGYPSDFEHYREREEHLTPYLKSCDFDLVVIYEW